MEKSAKCIVCGKKAVFFVSKVTQGKMTQIPYCKKHAQEAGLLDPHSYGFLDDGTEKGTIKPAVDPNAPRCKKCGFSLQNFNQLGRLGCPACYDSFSATLEQLIKKIQTGSKHLGKIPQKAWAEHLIKDRIKHLEVRLEKAVAGEHYEAAAAYRDQISEMKERTAGN